jgi:hypothetical protein
MIMGTRYPAPRGLDGKRRTATATYRGTKRQAEARRGLARRAQGDGIPRPGGSDDLRRIAARGAIGAALVRCRPRRGAECASPALEEVGTVVTIKSPKTRAGVRAVVLPAVAVEASATTGPPTRAALAFGIGCPANDALLFPEPTRGTPQSPRAVSKRWTSVYRRVATGVRWHSLRHLHISLLVRMRFRDVAARLGRAQIDTTVRTYTHQITPDDRRAADVLDRALG